MNVWSCKGIYTECMGGAYGASSKKYHVTIRKEEKKASVELQNGEGSNEKKIWEWLFKLLSL